MITRGYSRIDKMTNIGLEKVIKTNEKIESKMTWAGLHSRYLKKDVKSYSISTSYIKAPSYELNSRVELAV